MKTLIKLTLALVLGTTINTFAQSKYLTGDTNLGKNTPSSSNETVTQKAPNFDLKSTTGKSFSLENLKGKVVVIDFWATWCGPCKKALPGMQMAADFYKNDKDVVFLFINTWEKGSDTEINNTVKKFLKENNYNFTVLMDQKNQTSRTKYTVVDAYEIKGIPTKIIIDKNGNIKEKVVGLTSTSDQEILAEMKTLVESAKS